MKTKEKINWIEFEFERKTYEVQKEIYDKMKYIEAERIAKENDWKMLNVLQAGYLFDEKIIKDFCKEREWLENYSKLTREEGFSCSALSDYWSGSRLDVDGSGWYGDGDGRSFGVRFVKLKEEIKELEEEQEQDFKSIIYKNKEFRIYKWENKPIKDFVYPKGFRLIEHSEFTNLFNNEIIDYPKKGRVVYFTKHYSKRKQKENILSRWYLDRNLCLSSDSSFLSGSNDVGRVVLVRNLK